MKNDSGVAANGFLGSNIDASLKARTLHGEIVSFIVKDGKTTATYKGAPIKISDQLSNIGTLTDLINTLKGYVITGVVDGAVETVPMHQARALMAAANCPAAGCAADGGCAAHGGCLSDGCAARAGCAADGGCAALGCAADGGCAAKAGCAAEGCVGKACAADAGCAAKVCAGDACLANLPCPADGQIGPCAVNVPYCPVIL